MGIWDSIRDEGIMKRPENLAQIPGWPDYWVSECGRLFSAKYNKWKERKLTKNSSGYLTATLYNDGERWGTQAHCLVMLAFVGPPPVDEKGRQYEVDHKDQNKLNNHLNNLKYIAKRDHTLHSYAQGQYDNLCRAKRKLTDDQVEEMRTAYSNGGVSQKVLGEKYGIDPSTVGRIVRGLRYKRRLTR